MMGKGAGQPAPIYSPDNEVALEVLNAVIWKLWMAGEDRAAKIVEQERNRKAVETFDARLGEMGNDKQKNRSAKS